MLAERNLELMVAAALDALAGPSAVDPARAAVWDAAMEEMSADAYAFYREQVAENPDILPYFEQGTPVAELEHARIGSRPSKRGKSGGLNDLRAIPWVFGWMQSRHVLPAWFGVGHALERFADRGPDRAALLGEMTRTFPLFNDLIRNVEFTLFEKSRSMPLGDMMQHAAIHAVHHRGQVALLLRTLGYVPGNFDYVLFAGGQ